jgi:hypothetical protein
VSSLVDGLADDADALPAQTDRDLIGSDLVLQAGALLALVLGDAVAAENVTRTLPDCSATSTRFTAWLPLTATS